LEFVNNFVHSFMNGPIPMFSNIVQLDKDRMVIPMNLAT
jgi:hypothetical protein